MLCIFLMIISTAADKMRPLMPLNSLLSKNITEKTSTTMSITLSSSGSDEPDVYELITGHIGCHNGRGGPNNLGYIGRPRDFLSDVSSLCTSGDSRCIEIGERACSATPNCWGFAIHVDYTTHDPWGVQIYNNSASNQSVCSGTDGLEKNSHWNTYKKLKCDSLCDNIVNDLGGTCSGDGQCSFTLSSSGGLNYGIGGMDNNGGGFYAENICLLALYGENSNSYVTKGTFSKGSYVVGGGSWKHIHGISNEKLSDAKTLQAMGLYHGPCCFTSWTSLTCTWSPPSSSESGMHMTNDGCSGNENDDYPNFFPQCHLDSAKAAVRCCSMDGATCQSCMIPHTTSTPCHKYLHDGCLPEQASFTEAEKLCADRGLRLCSLSELEDKVCCGTGCLYDTQRIWTKDQCSEAI